MLRFGSGSSPASLLSTAALGRLHRFEDAEPIVDSESDASSDGLKLTRTSPAVPPPATIIPPRNRPETAASPSTGTPVVDPRLAIVERPPQDDACGALVIRTNQPPMIPTLQLVEAPAPAASATAPRPNVVLLIGGPGTGKSSLINAMRQFIAPRARFEVCPVGLIGRNSTTAVSYYTETVCDDMRRQPSWCFVDSPGRMFEHVNSKGHDDERLLEALVNGLPAGVQITGRYALPMRDLEALSADEATNRLVPEQVIFTVKATDLVSETKAWMGLRTKLEPSVAAVGTLHYVADVIDWLYHGTNRLAPHVVITHMDKFSDARAVEALIRAMLTCCPPPNQHFVSIPPAAPHPAPHNESDVPAVPVVPRAMSSRGPSGSPSSQHALVARIGAASIPTRATQSQPHPTHWTVAMGEATAGSLAQLIESIKVEIRSQRSRAVKQAASGANNVPLLSTRRS